MRRALFSFVCHFPLRYSVKEIKKFTSHPKGTAYHTIAMPNRGAIVIANMTRSDRLARLATVNIFISAAPRRRPSVHILRPIRAKKNPINLR